MTIRDLARYVHFRIRQPHSTRRHRAATWPYRAIFGTVAAGAMYNDKEAQ